MLTSSHRGRLTFGQVVPSVAMYDRRLCHPEPESFTGSSDLGAIQGPFKSSTSYRPGVELIIHSDVHILSLITQKCQSLVSGTRMYIVSLLLGLLLSASTASAKKEKGYMNRSCRYTWICNDKGCLGNDIEPYSSTLPAVALYCLILARRLGGS